MNRKLAGLVIFLLMFGVACGSLNRVLPSEVDAKAMEADVRGKIAVAVPEKTFAVEVDVDNHAVVTLSGHAANQSDINKIVDAAQSVSGVRRVINRLHIQR
jgi:osmotically-inducible protein OsmY